MIVDIIGGGIGGLTTAIALNKKGIRTRIFEQAENIKPVGAGIILANNAMQIYEKLGLRKVIEDNGNHISAMNITKTNLNLISKINLNYFEELYKVKNIAIHRGILQKILINELPLKDIYLNYHLDEVKPLEKGYLLKFTNGEQIKSSTLIGADGIKSIVRKELFSNSTIRNAKQVCWRGVTEFNLPNKYKKELVEAWGKASRFGFVQINDNKVYWYALKSIINKKNDFDINNIETDFYNYENIIGSIIKSTPKNQINYSEILDLKPINSWYKETACLIGDAAHAMTPNMGQGACQSIEDAYVISEYLSKYNVNEAFNKYQQIRILKAHKLVKMSWRVGKISQLSNPLLIEFRNRLMKISSSFNEKQYKQIFNIPNL